MELNRRCRVQEALSDMVLLFDCYVRLTTKVQHIERNNVR